MALPRHRGALSQEYLADSSRLSMRVREDYPEAHLIVLEQNYRSTGTILDAAHGVIQANIQRHPKELWTENDTGVQITRYEAYNEGEEADYGHRAKGPLALR